MSRRKIFIINLAFRTLGAHRTLRPKHFRQLTLTGVPEKTVRPVLPKIRSLKQWQTTWTRRADDLKAQAASNDSSTQEQANHYKDAAAYYYLADIFLMPDDPDHHTLTQQMVDAYQQYGNVSGAFTKREIQWEKTQVHCNLYHPSPQTTAPLIIMIPPLGSVKEQIDFQVQPFVNAGFACLTVDLPGVGQTTGAMPLDCQRVLQEVITQISREPNIDVQHLVLMGLSLGAYWSMKTAAVDSRVRLAVGISTPAISGKHWNRLPRHYWTHFQKAFGTPDLATTRQVTEQLSLFNVMDKITCPVLLVHGEQDNVSQPNAMDLFYRETTKAPLSTKVYPQCGHCCLDELTRNILPDALRWIQQQTVPISPGRTQGSPLQQNI